MKRRLLSIVMCITMSVAIFLTGCGEKKVDTSKNGTEESKKEDKGKKSSDGSSDTIKVSEAGVLPIVNQKITFDVLCSDNVDVDNFETNAFTKELEDATNIHLNWQIIPEENLKEKVNIVLSSGDYPDIFMDCAISPSQQMSFGKMGIFIPLNDYIDQYGINIQKAFKAKPYVEGIITLPDGNIYDIPYINECYHCTACHKYFIYKPWLETLGLNIPSTTEEFREVLRAFKNNDPNGNNQADEIPLAGTEKSWNGSIVEFLMNAFIYNEGLGSTVDNLFLVDGKVTSAFDKEEYRNGLKYMNELFEEGLIAPQSFTQDGDQLVRLGTQMPNILGVAPGGSFGVFTRDDMEEDIGRGFDYACLPPLEGPDGFRTVTLEPFDVYTGRYLISKSCEYPAAAFRMADLLYSEEWTLKSVEGKEGINWRKAEDGEMTLYNEQAKWVYIQKDEVDDENIQKNKSWVQTGPSYRDSEYRDSWAVTVPVEQFREAGRSANDLLDPITKECMEPYKPDLSTIIPPLVFNEQQSKEIPSLRTSINNYVQESVARFIIGDLDLDGDWDNYIKELNNMGLQKYLELYQQAYEDNK